MVILVCEIPKIFERASPSNLERKVFLSILNNRTIFERGLLSSDSVAKSATQNLWFSEIDTFKKKQNHVCNITMSAENRSTLLTQLEIYS